MNTRIFLTLLMSACLFGAEGNGVRTSYVQKRKVEKPYNVDDPNDPFELYETRSIEVFLNVEGYEPVKGRVLQTMPLTPGRILQVSSSLIVGALSFWMMGIPIASSPVSLIGEALVSKRVTRPYLKLEQKATGEEIRNTFYDISPFARDLRDVLSGRHYDIVDSAGNERRGYPMVLEIQADPTGRVDRINAIFELFHGPRNEEKPILDLKDVRPRKGCWKRIKEFTGADL